MSTELDKACEEFGAACWEHRWAFVALYVSVVLILGIIWVLQAAGDPRAIWAWGLLWRAGS